MDGICIPRGSVQILCFTRFARETQNLHLASRDANTIHVLAVSFFHENKICALQLSSPRHTPT